MGASCAAEAAALAATVPDEPFHAELAVLMAADPAAALRAGMGAELPAQYRDQRAVAAQVTVDWLSKVGREMVDDWLLGLDVGAVPPLSPATAANLLRRAGRVVEALTAVEAFRDGTVPADQVPIVVDMQDWNRFVARFGARPSVCPPQLVEAFDAR